MPSSSILTSFSKPLSIRHFYFPNLFCDLQSLQLKQYVISYPAIAVTGAPIISTFEGRKKRIATSLLLPRLQACLLILRSYAPTQVTASFTRYLKKLHAVVTNFSILKLEAICSSETFVRTYLATGVDTQKTTTQFLMRVTVWLWQRSRSFWKDCTFSENPSGSLSTFFHQINSLWGKKIISCDINDIVRDLEWLAGTSRRKEQPPTPVSKQRILAATKSEGV